MTEGRRPTRRKEARPAEFVEAAMDEFAERGFAGATIEAIAARAGAAKGTVYLYFRTKDELFEAAVRDNISPVFATIDGIVGTWRGSSAELLRRVILRLYQELIESPRRRVLMRVLIAEGARFPQLTAFYHAEVISGGKRLLTAILDRGIAAGEFRATPVRDHPEVLMGPAILASVWRMIFEHVAPLEVVRYAEAHVDLVLHGLLAEDRTSPVRP